MSLSDDDITNIFGIVKKVLNHQPSKVGSKYGTVHGAAIEKKKQLQSLLKMFSICLKSKHAAKNHTRPCYQVAVVPICKLCRPTGIFHVEQTAHSGISYLFGGKKKKSASQPDILG